MCRFEYQPEVELHPTRRSDRDRAINLPGRSSAAPLAYIRRLIMNWSEYQVRAAEFFSRLGLTTNIEFEVEGVRGIHVVDVYASGSFNGIAFNWVVECKAWKSNIPKEKVMALAAIVQDVGADRGFLLSEVEEAKGTFLKA
jgi:hypothetical protein